MAIEVKPVWRVLIVDDHPVVREGIRMCLKDCREMELVGEAVNGAEAIQLAKELKPDVVLLDLVMPRMNGLEALPGIRRAQPKARVLIFTYHNTPQHVQEAMIAHVDGYLLKDTTPAEYIRAIRKSMKGEFYISRAARRHLQGGNNNGQPRFGLTPREFEFLALAARGVRPRQIAKAMDCSAVTVRAHRRSVFRKLKLKTIAGLTRFALENGL